MKWHLHSFLVCQVHPLPLPRSRYYLTSLTWVSTWCQFTSSFFIHAPKRKFVIKTCPGLFHQHNVFVSLNHTENINHAVFMRISKDQTGNQKRQISRGMVHILYQIFLVPVPNYKDFCYSPDSKEMYSPKHICTANMWASDLTYCFQVYNV